MREICFMLIAADALPLATTEPEAARSDTGTWATLAVLLMLFALGVWASSRIRRSQKQTTEPEATK